MYRGTRSQAYCPCSCSERNVLCPLPLHPPSLMAAWQEKKLHGILQAILKETQ